MVDKAAVGVNVVVGVKVIVNVGVIEGVNVTVGVRVTVKVNVEVVTGVNVAVGTKVGVRDGGSCRTKADRALNVMLQPMQSKPKRIALPIMRVEGCT